MDRKSLKISIKKSNKYNIIARLNHIPLQKLISDSLEYSRNDLEKFIHFIHFIDKNKKENHNDRTVIKVYKPLYIELNKLSRMVNTQQFYSLGDLFENAMDYYLLQKEWITGVDIDEQNTKNG